MNRQSIEDACRYACLTIGVEYKTVPSDGHFHAANIADDPRGKNDARIKIFPDCQGGIVWNHKADLKKTFFINVPMGEHAPPVDKKRIEREKLKRKRELEARQDKAAKRASIIWNSAMPAPSDHPYLVRKQIKPHGLKAGQWTRLIFNEDRKHKTLTIDNVLLLPLLNEHGVIRSLQAIFPECNQQLGRDKDFLPSGGLAGLFWVIGDKTDTVLICEGFATAATLHEETGYRVYIAFTANNLLSIAQLVRAKLPDISIVMCADNDKSTGNPGLTKANEAATQVGATVAIPPIWGDFNDYAIF